MSQKRLIFQNLTFSYAGLSREIFRELSFELSGGWTGIIGRNGVGKSTLLRLAAGVLPPDKGQVILSGSCIYCAQSTEEKPALPEGFLESDDHYTYQLMSMLEIRGSWLGRWESLSHGERKRIQIAAALYQDPDCFALDEPTNHLDEETKRKIVNTLRQYRGLGLIVSHDRSLLDDLCTRCLFISQQKCVIRPGGYTQGRDQERLEEESVLRKYGNMKKEQARLKKEIIRRREQDARARRRCTKRNLDPRDSDGRGKVNRARLTGKDATGGKLIAQITGRYERLVNESDRISLRKAEKTGVTLYSAVSGKDRLWQNTDSKIPLGAAGSLILPELVIRPGDRIGLTGSNGTGKSTLVNHILQCIHIPEEKRLCLPQEIVSSESVRILERIRRLPNSEKGKLLSCFSRLGSAPESLLETEMPSPGETRKMLLCLGLLAEPELIVLDEPTNHLDIVSMECLEALLGECRCSLVLVSHDRVFIGKLTDIRWHIVKEEKNSRLRVL